MACARIIAGVLLFMACGLVVPSHSAEAAPACTGLAGAALTSCIDEVGTWECRSSESMSQLRACFTDTARKLIASSGRRVSVFDPDCTVDPTYRTMACSIDPGWGAGEQWCVREDAQTVSMCEGDPPNHRCRRQSCPIGRCACGWVRARFNR
jgi:hypothetical protein